MLDREISGGLLIRAESARRLKTDPPDNPGIHRGNDKSIIRLIADPSRSRLPARFVNRNVSPSARFGKDLPSLSLVSARLSSLKRGRLFRFAANHCTASLNYTEFTRVNSERESPWKIYARHERDPPNRRRSRFTCILPSALSPRAHFS